MRLRNKVGNVITGKVQRPFAMEAMEKIGLQTISTERIGERIESQKQFNSLFNMKPQKDATPEEKFDFYVKQLEDIWGMYKANQVAWLRAGSNGPFGQMVTAIEGMKVHTNIAIDANRTILAKLNENIEERKPKKGEKKKIERKKEQLVRNFYTTWLILLMFQYVSKMGNFCWLLEDVNTPESFPIMTTQPIQPERAEVNEELLKGETDVSE